MRTNHNVARLENAVLNPLKTARGHLDAVIRMVEDDTSCADLMEQLSAVQGSLDRANRIVLCNHLETRVPAETAPGLGLADQGS